MTALHSVCSRFSVPHTVSAKDKRGEEEWWSNRLEFHTNSKQMNIARESSGVLLRVPPELDLLFLLPCVSGELCWPWVFPVKTHLSSKRHMPGSRVHPSHTQGKSVLRISSKHQQVGISWHEKPAPTAAGSCCRSKQRAMPPFQSFLTYFNVRSWILGGKGSYAVPRGYYLEGSLPPWNWYKNIFTTKREYAQIKNCAF